MRGTGPTACRRRRCRSSTVRHRRAVVDSDDAATGHPRMTAACAPHDGDAPHRAADGCRAGPSVGCWSTSCTSVQTDAVSRTRALAARFARTLSLRTDAASCVDDTTAHGRTWRCADASAVVLANKRRVHTRAHTRTPTHVCDDALTRTPPPTWQRGARDPATGALPSAAPPPLCCHATALPCFDSPSAVSCHLSIAAVHEPTARAGVQQRSAAASHPWHAQLHRTPEPPSRSHTCACTRAVRAVKVVVVGCCRCTHLSSGVAKVS
jgi:hypothetical protein